MAAVRLYELSGVTESPSVRLYSLTGRSATTKSVRLYELTGAASVALSVQLDEDEITLPGARQTVITALPTDSNAVLNFSSSPTVTLTGSGNTRSYVTPSTLDGTVITFTVTATLGGLTATDQIQHTILPQIEWQAVGGQWIAQSELTPLRA